MRSPPGTSPAPVWPALSCKRTTLRVKKGAWAPLKLSSMLSRPATGTTRICATLGVLDAPIASSLQPEHAIHRGEDGARDQRGRSVGDRHRKEQGGDHARPVSLRKPVGEVHDDSREEACLGDTEQKPHRQKAGGSS